MPKTPAERQKERRARLKNNKEALEKYHEEDRLRKQKRKASMTPGESAALRYRTMLNTRAWRAKSTESAVSKTMETPYKSAQAFGKARQRVENVLPVSPHKRLAVVEGIASRYLSVKFQPTFTVSRIRGLDSVTKTLVNDYYQTDTISRMTPGKADVVSMKDDNGVKIKLQKRHMTMTVSEAFQLFKADNPGCQVGKSSFAALRPKFVLLSSQMPQNVCGCKYHNNVILLLECLHRKRPMIPLYSKEEFLSQCVCDLMSEMCMANQCEVCNDGKLFESNITEKVEALGESCRWFQWTEDASGYLVKAPQDGCIEDALERLKNQLPKFCWHVFIKTKQSQSYEEDKAGAKNPDSTTSMMQMDFAENFTASFQDEIQSAHWKQRQISIFTIMAWCRGTTDSSVIVSDVREHDKRSVATYTRMALKRTMANMPFVKTVHIWTDGPSSQFKNRYIFSLIGILENELQLSITWNFSATSHGKGPNDGLGGNVKRIAQQRVLTRQAVVTDAVSFVNTVTSATSNINVMLSTQNDIENTCTLLKLDEIWSDTPIVPGTINTHHVASCGNGKVNTKFYTSARTCKVHHLKKSIVMPLAKVDDEASSCSDESDDIPLAMMKENSLVLKYPCGQCGWVFGDQLDPKLHEDWLKCSCDKWFHESCAEMFGILEDDAVFTCSNCL